MSACRQAFMWRLEGDVEFSITLSAPTSFGDKVSQWAWSCLMNFRDQPVSTLPSLGLQESTATMLSWLQELWASELGPSCLQVKHFPVQAILSILKSLREPAHKNEHRNDRKFLCWKQTLLLLKHMNNCNYFMWGRILRSQSHVHLFTMTFHMTYRPWCITSPMFVVFL